MPARCPAYMALAASWFSRWMPPGSSEWMIGRPPACWLRAAFCWTPSIASSLNPHQSAQTETEVPSLASRSAILRSEEHTSELQSRLHLVCRLLLEKKKKQHSRNLYCIDRTLCTA